HEEAHAGALVGVGLGDVLAVEEDLAFGHLEVRVAHHGVGERRLARAVRPHQGVDLALADGEVEALEDLFLAGADVEVANFELCHGLRGCRVGGQAAGATGSRPATTASRRENSTNSASVVVWSERAMPLCTRIHSSFVAQCWPASVSCMC